MLYRGGKVFGNVDKNGNVTEFTAKRYLLHYEARKEEVKEIPRAETPKEHTAVAAGDDASVSSETTSTSGVMADVQLEILVEDTLKGARQMSIDSLLEGFNYGL